MNGQGKPKWHTPQIESLEINAPQKCNKPFSQSDLCQQQGEPYQSIPCVPIGKGGPGQVFS